MVKTQTFLASNLQFLIEKRGLNPNSLADSLGNKPPQATIFRILTGESQTPRDDTVQPLADFFGVQVHELRYADLSVDASDSRLTTAAGGSAGGFNLDSALAEEGVKSPETATAEELKDEIKRAVAEESLSNELLVAIAWMIRAGTRASARGDQHHEETVKLKKHGRAPARGRTGTG